MPQTTIRADNLSFAGTITAKNPWGQERWNGDVAWDGWIAPSRWTPRGVGTGMTGHAVVIAGGGPTGMMLAAELTLGGVDVAVIERRSSQDLAGSRSGGLHSRTIEVLDQRGVADRFLAEGRAMQVQAFAGIPLDISDFPTRHNYGLALWQDDFERILAAWVDELGVPITRRARGHGIHAGRFRRRRRVVRRPVAPGGVPRRV